MLKRLAGSAALGILLTACAGGPPPEPPAPPPLDPSGTYDITVLAEGMEILGVMIISGTSEEGFSGSIDTDMGGASMYNILVEGQTMTFTIPDVGIDAEVVFEGNGFSGGMVGDMGDAAISGSKRSGR